MPKTGSPTSGPNFDYDRWARSPHSGHGGTLTGNRDGTYRREDGVLTRPDGTPIDPPPAPSASKPSRPEPEIPEKLPPLGWLNRYSMEFARAFSEAVLDGTAKPIPKKSARVSWSDPQQKMYVDPALKRALFERAGIEPAKGGLGHSLPLDHDLNRLELTAYPRTDGRVVLELQRRASAEPKYFELAVPSYRQVVLDHVR